MTWIGKILTVDIIIETNKLCIRLVLGTMAPIVNLWLVLLIISLLSLFFFHLVLKPLMYLFFFLWSHEGDQLCTFTMRGSAFLWHQVRAMVAVLFMIGQGVESVDVSFRRLHVFFFSFQLNPTLLLKRVHIFRW